MSLFSLGEVHEKILVTLTPKFEKIKTITVIDILRKSEALVTLAATVTGVL